MANKKLLRASKVGMEALEGRRLLSHGGHGHTAAAIEFSQAPTAVQTGLDTLSATTVDPTTSVHLANRDGLELYSIDLTGTGTDTTYTVDQNGVAISDPTHSTTTYADLVTTDSAAATELSTLATALNLTAPADATSVNVVTSSAGLTTYSLRLTSASSTSSHARGTTLTVDAAGNPAGVEQVPFSTLPAAIQTGLANATPAGATALASTSTVSVATVDGVETYSATFRGTGTKTTVTVDNTGTLTSLPSRTKVLFSTLPAAAQAELQTLATAKGFTGTIDPSSNVTEYTEASGNVVYSVSVKATGTRSSGSTFTFMVTVSSDAAGNPTVPPSGGRDGGGCSGFGVFYDGNDDIVISARFGRHRR